MASTLAESTDPYCLRAGEAAELLRGHPWRRFIALGDSVVEGSCEPTPGYSDVQWADRVASELDAARPGLAYLNLGRSGLRAHQVRAEQLAPALAFAPDLALVVCGGNDAFRPAYDADAVDAELTAMIIALRDVGAHVITVGMFDVSYSPAVPEALRPGLRERMRRLSARTARLAERLGTVHVHLTDHPLTADPTLYSTDGRHGSARSDAIATAETLRALSPHRRP
ncbi:MULTISPECIES: SGNH/GDSL hydrolase family protein [unclassified Micromonospora]|uniref:SGNH/GDSL hydrolase family protein n=1 Tax=unclassified Micromonospora TaxID=2617518 RepID=UPI001B373B83|nr:MULTISPECIES: SGNH/GDSL hydrolase family protein [unclassified Micromonospora]MBQ0978170.1 SGNH/GDSL hydrolase family protein [Micromonospora sp. M61]MBQ1034671.1 SGNH/GDSL hydrolase family protein [Micromonospora sp. C81]